MEPGKGVLQNFTWRIKGSHTGCWSRAVTGSDAHLERLFLWRCGEAGLGGRRLMTG